MSVTRLAKVRAREEHAGNTLESAGKGSSYKCTIQEWNFASLELNI